MKSTKISDFLFMLRSDKVSTHSYGKVYDIIFSNIKIERLLEIGIAHGASINAFGLFLDKSNVYGVDINKKLVDECRILSDNINLIIYDAIDASILNKISDIKFDIIIDDASHKPEYQKKTFDIYQNLLSENGVYVIEDVKQELLLDVDFCSKFKSIDLRKVRDRYDDYLLIHTTNKELLHLL